MQRGKGACKWVSYKYKLAVSVIWFWINFVRASGDIIRKRAKVIQTTSVKEKNGYSGQLARTGKKCLQ